MTVDTSIQKALLLLGEGANGKSTFLTGVTNFLGRPNVVAMSLHKIEADRFSAARLMGKFANICPDLPSTHLETTSLFKAITGGDEIPAEYKFRDGFDFRPFVKLLFSANASPRSRDGSHAFFRRWLVVPFTGTFEGASNTPRDILDAQLADPGELSGLLNKALEVLPGLRNHGFTESESMQEAHADFRQSTDPMAVWLDRNTIELASACVTKGDLCASYNAKCDQESRPFMNSRAFGHALKRLKPHITEGQRGTGSNKTWVWNGIGLLE